MEELKITPTILIWSAIALYWIVSCIVELRHGRKYIKDLFKNFKEAEMPFAGAFFFMWCLGLLLFAPFSFLGTLWKGFISRVKQLFSGKADKKTIIDLLNDIGKDIYNEGLEVMLKQYLKKTSKGELYDGLIALKGYLRDLHIELALRKNGFKSIEATYGNLDELSARIKKLTKIISEKWPTLGPVSISDSKNPKHDLEYLETVLETLTDFYSAGNGPINPPPRIHNYEELIAKPLNWFFEPRICNLIKKYAKKHVITIDSLQDCDKISEKRLRLLRGVGLDSWHTIKTVLSNHNIKMKK